MPQVSRAIRSRRYAEARELLRAHLVDEHATNRALHALISTEPR